MSGREFLELGAKEAKEYIESEEFIDESISHVIRRMRGRLWKLPIIRLVEMDRGFSYRLAVIFWDKKVVVKFMVKNGEYIVKYVEKYQNRLLIDSYVRP